ncbi:MAG: hypothetical protein OEY91_05150, partial [Nitrospirota bacterium]|nr:hypothetical protein [Nitrospirota bacterium]
MVSWLPIRQFFFLLACLLMVSSGLLVYWLYVGALEREHVRVMDLAWLHAKQLEALSAQSTEDNNRLSDHETIAVRVQRIFDAQQAPHHFGETGEILLVLEGIDSGEFPGSPYAEHEFLVDGLGRIFLTASAPIRNSSLSVVARI